MKVTQDDMDKIAELAQLNISEQEIDNVINSMSRILDLVDEMQLADTTNVAPLANPLDSKQRMREDEVTETNQRDYYQSIAPETEQGLYLVPRVIE